MKIALLFIFLTTSLYLGCNDDPTPPEDFPQGYQQDISWPSLADSPWPLYHGNAQNSGRTKASGPTQGSVEWIYNPAEFALTNTGVAVTRDSLIIIPFDFSLKALTFNGTEKWSVKLSGEGGTTAPVIAADGTIYCCSHSLFAINSNGTIKWKYSTGKPIWRLSLNIGMDGKIYFTDNNNTFHALNPDGSLNWKLTDQVLQFGNLSAISPDGKTIYVNGNNPTLIAIDLEQQKIKWTFGEFSSITDAPLVDSEGHVYISTKESSYNSTPGMYCLNSDKSVKWFYPHYQWASDGSKTKSDFGSPAMDKLGNLYFGCDTLFSLDYSGKLRWAKSLNSDSYTPIICDAQNNIFMVLQTFGKDQEIVSYNQSGIENFRIKGLKDDETISSPAIAFGRLIISTQGNTIYSIK